MRILKLFKKHVLALFAAIVLIVISCNADLALPTYMSDIVDVGVQQGGIASPVPDTIRAESLDDLELFMSAKDAKTVEAAFGKADKNGIRTYKGTEEERADGGKIADIMSLPETVVLSLNQGIDASSMGDMMDTSSEEGNNAAPSMPTPEQMAAMTPEQLAEMQQKAAAAQNMQKQIDADGGKITMKSLRLGIEGGLVDQSKLVEGANEMADKMGSMSGSIVTQRAVTYVQEEYKAQGIDRRRAERLPGPYGGNDVRPVPRVARCHHPDRCRGFAHRLLHRPRPAPRDLQQGYALLAGRGRQV